jgi:ABC-2 type transport system ATP-binding protein
MAAEVAVAAKGLSVSRDGEIVIRDISFEVPFGAWFGLLGANGSGKTTALMALAGRLPVDAGRLTLAGCECSRDDAARSANVGFAPPPESLPNLLTGGELLALLARSRSAAPDAPRIVFDALGLDHLLDHPIESMSSGMRQRLAIFCAFVGERRVVMLDEPFNWLDPVAAFDLKSALSELVAGGLALVTALHDVGTFATRCSAGVWLHEGQLARAFARQELEAAARDLIGFERTIHTLFRADVGLQTPPDIAGQKGRAPR